MATLYPDARGDIAMDDTDLQQAVQKDLQWKPRVDAAHAAPSAGFLHIVVGYDGSAPASRALDAAVRLLQGRIGCIGVVWVAHLSSTGRQGVVAEETVPNMVAAGQPAPTFFGAYAQWAATPPPAWEDVAWLRQLWGGPFLVKGITRVDDAKRAVDAGATAVSVSNHGGNDLDGTPATIRALPAVASAVGGQVEVLLDGGIRRGGDVVKAVALGARAVMIGRAYLWGLAANGQAGVENVLDIMRGGIDSALLGLGKASIADLTPDDIVVPPGFTRTLGGDGPVFDPALDEQAVTG